MSAKILPFPGQDCEERYEVALEDVRFALLKATLRDSDPLIWRRVIVPEELDLEGLHGMLQVLFDWEGSHLYYFRRGDSFYEDERLLEEMAEESCEPGETHVCAENVLISSVLPDVGSTIDYVYDLGDFWDIEIEHEGVLLGTEYPFDLAPVCVGGAGASPLEDVGGIGGHAEFCLAVSDPTHPQHDELREWAGLDPDEEFDPDYFSTFDVNQLFAIVMVEQLEEELVPSDPDELREAYVDLLAEKIAGTAEQMIDVAAMLDEMDALADE